MVEPTRPQPAPQASEATPIPNNKVTGAPLRGDARLVAAWREWLQALATDAEAALAAAIAYRELEVAAREEWLQALEQDAPELSVPRVAVYAPLLAVEADAERRDRIQRAMGPVDSEALRTPVHALRGIGRDGLRVCVLVAPLYLDFVQVLACGFREDRGFEWVRHDPIVGCARIPKPGEPLEEAVLEDTPLTPLIDELAHAVLSHERGGRELPEALRMFADLFGPAMADPAPKSSAEW